MYRDAAAGARRLTDDLRNLVARTDLMLAVEFALKDGRVADDVGPIPLQHVTCATRLTEPDGAIRELAGSVLNLTSASVLIALFERIVADGGSMAGENN